MNIGEKNRTPDLKSLNDELKLRLSELEENLDAISKGKADAIVVQTEDGMNVFTIQGAETAYRIMVENMNEGALTIDSEGIVFYTNDRFCTMIDSPCSFITGKLLQDFVCPECKECFNLLLKKTTKGAKVHQDIEFIRRDGSSIPGISGIELTKNIHADFPEIKILIVTGHEVSRYYDYAIKAGADDVLSKENSRELVNRCIVLLM